MLIEQKMNAVLAYPVVDCNLLAEGQATKRLKIFENLCARAMVFDDENFDFNSCNNKSVTENAPKED